MPTIAEVLQQAWTIHQAGDLPRAEKMYRDVVMLHGENATAWCYLGMALHDQRRYDEAVAAYHRALALEPRFPVALSNLGNTLSKQSKFEEAAASCRQALKLKPDYVTAYNNLGAILTRQGKLDEAAATFEAAIQYNPQFGPAHNNLGALLVKQGKLDEAERQIEEALRRNPDNGDAHNNMGAVLVKQGKLAEAESRIEEAIRHNPQFEQAQGNLANAQLRQGKLDAAQASIDETLRVNPGYAEARKAQALIWLLMGDFARGWPAYEWRWSCEDTRRPKFDKPVWDGSPLNGQTLLLCHEQGLGDTLHFVRYAREIKEQRGGNIVVLCQKPLLPILSRTEGIDRLVVQGTDPEPFDAYVPLLSVPGLLGTDLTNIPADVPYLFPDDKLLQHWRKKLAAHDTFNVGIAWQGNKDHQADVQRSIPLAEFARLAEVPGIRLFSLQKGFGSEQIAQLQGSFEVAEFGETLDEGPGAFMDTAAIMKSLDLVVTTDTAIAHLAGGLGVPVWVALCFSPDWRWLLQRDDSPWYPTMRPFRQTELGRWDDVFQQMANALPAEFSAHRGGPAAAVSGAEDQDIDSLNQPAAPASRGHESKSIRVEISPGELVDKITILQIKAERIDDANKLQNVGIQLGVLKEARDRAIDPSDELSDLSTQLKRVNEELWDIEDDIRDCERAKDFGPRFIELARAVYRTNDRRAALKREIDDLLGSRLVEEKSYADYEA